MAQRSRRGRRTPKSGTPSESPTTPAPGGLPGALARGLGALTAGLAVSMPAGVGVRIGRALLSPEAVALQREAGRYLRELRELAGLTLDELAQALEVGDRSLLAAVEKGTATLSFELILRLSALLARNDPVPFVAKLVRAYNPPLWRLLEAWGIGRIPLQLERERRFVNVYRSHDAARTLSDAGFERVLDFTRSAFELALDYAVREESGGRRRKRGARRTTGRS